MYETTNKSNNGGTAATKEAAKTVAATAGNAGPAREQSITRSNSAERQEGKPRAGIGGGQGQTGAVLVPTERIAPNRFNARRTFDRDALKELAQNIAVFGLIQPVTVRRAEGEGGAARYEIICGERRYRACLMLKHAAIPVIVREVTDDEAYDLSISENLQREDVLPMEAAEAYKRLIDTKRYDVKSLALQFGKSEKHVYQTLKLCDLIPGAAKLVRAGKLTASAGIVISKYGRKVQEAILKDRLGEDGRGEWCHISAAALESAVQRCYTNDLAGYRFDKTECLKCNGNSSNYDLFADGNGCGKCADKKCLDAKQTAYLVAEAQKIAKADPKVTFIDSSSYGYGSSNRSQAAEQIRGAGHEFKSVQTWSLSKYPEAPIAPQAFEYRKPEDFARAQKRYDREREQHAGQVKRLDALKEQGKIRVYAEIGNDGVELRYKEVAAKDAKTDEQLISGWEAKKERNTEIAKEKTAEEVKTLLGKEQLPQSAFTADEEAMMYFFMLSKLRRASYKAAGLSDRDYYMTDEKKLKFASKLTEEQKTVVRREYLYGHLTDGTMTTSSVKGGLMLSFAKLHLPERTAAIETSYKEEYDRKNARLDERIAELSKQRERGQVNLPPPGRDESARSELSKQAKPAKGGAKAPGQEQAVEAAAAGQETPKTADKAAAKAVEASKPMGTGDKTANGADKAPAASAGVPETAPAAPVAAPAKTAGKAAEQPNAAAEDAVASEALKIVPSKIDGKQAGADTGSAKAIPAPAPAANGSKGDGRPETAVAGAPNAVPAKADGKAAVPPAGKIHAATVPSRGAAAQTA
jgi:ParB family chromosome partitioning protein